MPFFNWNASACLYHAMKNRKTKVYIPGMHTAKRTRYEVNRALLLELNDCEQSSALCGSDFASPGRLSPKVTLSPCSYTNIQNGMDYDADLVDFEEHYDIQESVDSFGTTCEGMMDWLKLASSTVMDTKDLEMVDRFFNGTYVAPVCNTNTEQIHCVQDFTLEDDKVFWWQLLNSRLFSQNPQLVSLLYYESGWKIEIWL